MHLIGIRRNVFERNPWIASSLFKAFEQAKAACYSAIEDDNALQITLPWSLQSYSDTRKLMGADYWPYGTAKNADALDAMVRYSREQGLTREVSSFPDLFVPCDEERASV